MLLTEIIDNKKTNIYCFEKYSKEDFAKIRKGGLYIELQEISHFEYTVADHIVGIPKGFQGALTVEANNLGKERNNTKYYFFDKKTIDSIMNRLNIRNYSDFDKAMGKHIQQYSGSIGVLGFSIP
jgi:hypothetical protein